MIESENSTKTVSTGTHNESTPAMKKRILLRIQEIGYVKNGPISYRDHPRPCETTLHHC